MAVAPSEATRTGVFGGHAGGVFENRADAQDSDEGADEGREPLDEGRGFFVGSFAVAEEAGDGGRQAGDAVVWEPGVEVAVHVEVQKLGGHFGGMVVAATVLDFHARETRTREMQ